MARFVDFGTVKKDITFEAAIALLQLEAVPEGRNGMGNRTWRAYCPACDSDRALFITEKEGYFCHTEDRGGDVIGLAAHVLSLRMRDAAVELLDRAGTRSTGTSTVRKSTSQRTVPESERVQAKAPPARPRGGGHIRSPPQPTGFDPAAFSAKLQYTDEVAELGISEEDAEALGIGFYRGKLYQALRYENGDIAGFSAFAHGELKLPSTLLPMTNVVALRRA